MNIKCRILSIIVVAICSVVTLISIIVVANKNKKDTKVVYAEDISFVGNISSVELMSGNELIVTDDLINVKPSNCSCIPEFTIKKYDSTDEPVIIKDRYEFATSGKYTLYCKIKSNENYYIKDSIIFTVVNIPTDDTNMYISVSKRKILYVEDKIDLSSLATIVAPSSAKINYQCSQHITLVDNIITAVESGEGIIEVTIDYDNIVITETITINIKPKLVKSDITLQLTAGKTVLPDNVVLINNLKYNFAVDYLFVNFDNQLINCWTDSDNVEVISFNAPTIILKPKFAGETIIYISPVDYQDFVFEVVVRVGE